MTRYAMPLLRLTLASRLSLPRPTDRDAAVARCRVIVPGATFGQATRLLDAVDTWLALPPDAHTGHGLEAALADAMDSPLLAESAHA